MSASRRTRRAKKASLLDEAELLSQLQARQSKLSASALQRASELAVSLDRIQEIHHRVRNHLQAVMGLLSAEESHTNSTTARQAIQRAAKRVAAFAAVYDLLARSAESEVMPAHTLLEELAQKLVATSDSAALIALDLKTNPLSLDPRRAGVLAITAAEFISNALEHAFGGKRGGTLTIRLSGDEREVFFEVRDDGPGLPVGFHPGATGELGLSLIERLVHRELAGSLTAFSDNGAVFHVHFPTATDGGAEQ